MQKKKKKWNPRLCLCCERHSSWRIDLTKLLMTLKFQLISSSPFERKARWSAELGWVIYHVCVMKIKLWRRSLSAQSVTPGSGRIKGGKHAICYYYYYYYESCILLLGLKQQFCLLERRSCITTCVTMVIRHTYMILPLFHFRRIVSISNQH